MVVQAPKQPKDATKLLLRGVLEEMARRGIDPGDDGGSSGDYSGFGPQTDDELYNAITELTGKTIPRVAVCEGHIAPFQTFADLYFERIDDVLWIGPRGGGKTANSGWLHGAKSLFKPGYTTAIAGAIDKQSERGYREFLRFISKLVDDWIEGEPQKKSTKWIHGSENEILAGTVAACNGPHPHFAQFDELELIRSIDVFEEWLNMSQGTPEYNGQQLLTSTRKRAYGMVQALVKECEEAIKAGDTPPWVIQIFCIWETLANVPTCQKRDEDGNLLCGCDKVVKGEWADGSKRTFADACAGKAAKSQGFVQLKDAHRRFRTTARRTWEAQQECLRPSTEGLVHQWWDPEKYQLPYWLPRAEYGPIYRSWDWGGTNEHSVHWTQILRFDVRLLSESGKEEIIVREGSLVTFDEVYHSGGGAYSLGLEVFERTEEWAKHGFNIIVEQDFADPANPTARADVKKAAHDGGYAEPSFKAIPSTVEISLEKHIEWGEDGKLHVVGAMCPNLIDNYNEYHWPDWKPGFDPMPKKPVQVNDHAVDDQRYLIWNLYKLGFRAPSTEGPASDNSAHVPQHYAAEAKARKFGRKIGGDSPVASSLSPGYIQGNPQTSQPMVRRGVGRSVRSSDPYAHVVRGPGSGKPGSP